MSNLVVWARRRTGLLALVFVLAIVVIAACTDSEGPTATSVPPTATSTTVAVAPTATQPAPTATPMSEEDDPGAAVGVHSGGGLGDILVDADRMTLYIFDNDTEGVSNCSGGCLDAWPPFLSEGDPVAGDGVTAVVGTITRDDGTMQVTVNRLPRLLLAERLGCGRHRRSGPGQRLVGLQRRRLAPASGQGGCG